MVAVSTRPTHRQADRERYQSNLEKGHLFIARHFGKRLTQDERRNGALMALSTIIRRESSVNVFGIERGLVDFVAREGKIRDELKRINRASF